MARKRSRYTRARDRFRRRRPKGPLPTEGWLLADLVKLANTTPRRVRYYLEQGLLPKPAFRGTATRHGRETLLRLLAIPRLQSEEHLPLAVVKKRLSLLTPAALEAYAVAKLEAGPTATALGVARPDSHWIGGLAQPDSPPRYQSQRWDHVHLLPGLALIVSANASPLLRKIVEQIHDHCVAASTTSEISGILPASSTGPTGS